MNSADGSLPHRRQRDPVTDALNVGRGHPQPFGASQHPDGINFAVFSRHARAVHLVLYRPGEAQPLVEIPFDPKSNRTGDVWHMGLQGLSCGFEYGFRVFGPAENASPIHRFDASQVLLDPYARAISGPSLWRQALHRGDQGNHWRSLLVESHFDWGDDRPINRHLADSVIYEMHVRGFTRHESSEVDHPGTFRGVIEKIPYLQQLGVTAVELLPVTEFDEADNYRKNPINGESLHNFWGYHPLSFFAPKAAYAVNPTDGAQVDEFKEMVKALHTAGIEVILDMVFNHTGEGNEEGRTLSLRGLDNSIYYILDPKTGAYANYSGCGNTVNCNHPVVRELIIDALCYWVTEMHVDGFRFDLASILGRGPDGEVLTNPPLIERIAGHPVLADTKLIAEAWDAAGLYQVGSFPNFGRWAEWNGKFRDDIRRFVRGDQGMVSTLATRLAGSSDLYQDDGRAPYHSINFVTSHDGFTLADLVSYKTKHNEANGEYNADGESHNFSCNHGVEGPTDDPTVIALRERQIRNFATLLILAHGVPMLLAGDEMGRSQNGNNNVWCQDNALGWIDWNDLNKPLERLTFFQNLIAFRQSCNVLRPRNFEGEESGERRLSWHGQETDKPDWSEESHSLAMHLQGRPEEAEIYLIAHAAKDPAEFTLPRHEADRPWRLFVDTAHSWQQVITSATDHPVLSTPCTYPVGGQSVVVLIRHPKSS
ncbi:MAG: glycogen debranching protein GlgX [Desulfuromonadales bacterium]